MPAAQVVLSLARLNRIRQVDAVNRTMTVDAGCILQHIQEAAAAEGCLFPLSLAAEGSCTIGGNLPPMPAARRCCATATRANCAWAGSGHAAGRDLERLARPAQG
jgi:hypothetical protein